MTSNVPVNLEALRADVKATRATLKQKEDFLRLAERLYSNGFAPAVTDERVVRRRRKITSTTTRSAILKILHAHRNQPFRIPELVEEMERIGWRSESARKAEVVRTAVVRLTEDPDTGIQKGAGYGTYVYEPDGEGV